MYLYVKSKSHCSNTAAPGGGRLRVETILDMHIQQIRSACQVRMRVSVPYLIAYSPISVGVHGQHPSHVIGLLREHIALLLPGQKATHHLSWRSDTGAVS